MWYNYLVKAKKESVRYDRSRHYHFGNIGVCGGCLVHKRRTQKAIGWVA
jgi:hypothetical protein